MTSHTAPAITRLTAALLLAFLHLSASGASRDLSFNEGVPQEDVNEALTGSYIGAVNLPDSTIRGAATLLIRANSFTLIVRQPQSRPASFTGRLNLRLEGASVETESGDCQFIFDRASGGRTISVRVRLTSAGWILKGNSEQRVVFAFAQTDCPVYPYCQPVLTCRPCEASKSRGSRRGRRRKGLFPS